MIFRKDLMICINESNCVFDKIFKLSSLFVFSFLSKVSCFRKKNREAWLSKNRFFKMGLGGAVFVYSLLFSNFFCCLSATENEALTLRALVLHDQGFNYLYPFIRKNEIQDVHSKEKEFIKNFPFFDYSQINIQDQGIFFVDNINDSIKNLLREGHPWELINKNIIEANVSPGSIAVDIGSHIGTHTVTMSKCIGPEGVVFAFEPNKKIFRELCLNLSVNHCVNVNPIRCAIGKEQCLIKVITSHPNNEGGCYVIKDQEGTNTASMIRLDDLGLFNVSFIKIDVENMEADVIEGATETIKRCRPVMLVEIQGNGERPLQLGEDTKKMSEESIQKIQNLGYSLLHVVGADYLAIPDEKQDL